MSDAAPTTPDGAGPQPTPTAPASDTPPANPQAGQDPAAPIDGTNPPPPAATDPQKPASFFDKKEPTPIPADVIKAHPTLEKFKTYDALAKSYVNLEQRLGQLSKNQNKAPEKYDPAIVPEGLQVNDNTWEAFRKLNLTDAQAQGVLSEARVIFGQLEHQRLELEKQRFMDSRGMQTDEQFNAWLRPIEVYAIETLGEAGAAALGTNIAGLETIEHAMKMAARAEQMPEGSVNTPTSTTIQKMEQELASIVSHSDYQRDQNKVNRVVQLAEQITAAKGS